MSMGSTLVKLLAEDGHAVPESGPQNRLIHCFNPAHEDKNPSCSINVTKGVYSCFSCGIKGGVLDYLMLVRNMSKEEALDVLKGHGWSKESLKKQRDKAEAKEVSHQGLPAPPVTELPEQQFQKGGRVIARKVAAHEYRTRDGALVCVRIRFEPLEEHLRDRVKKVLPYTPQTKEGKQIGWWPCDPKKDGLPAEDRLDGPYPLYRLAELLERIQQCQAQEIAPQVWIVEGEKCVDLVMQHFPQQPCTTSLHHYTTKAGMQKIEWEPLRGHKVLLLSDEDDTGRRWVMATAALLHRQYACTVRVVLPPGETHRDIGNSLEEGGQAKAMEWIGNIQPKNYPEDFPDLKAEPDPDPGDDAAYLKWGETEHFRVLGAMPNKRVIIQPFSTHEPMVFSLRELNTETTLFALAPLRWWEENLPGGFTSKQRSIVVSHIIEYAGKKGMTDLNDIIGRGAIKDAGKVYYNVGMYVLTEDAAGSLTVKQSFKDLPLNFSPAPNIDLVDVEEREGVIACREFYDTLMQYRFASANEARSFLGWIVTSLIGGALRFRPMMWVMGPGGIGKTFLLTDVLKPVLGNALRYQFKPTEAGIAQQVSSASLPLCVDEFEPTQENKDAYEAILQLIRASTSGEAERVRGGAEGRVSSVLSVRFSILVSSVNQKNLTAADRSRFTNIRFSHEGVQDWERLQEAIWEKAGRERGRVIRSHIIKHAGHIVQHAEQLSRLLLRQYQDTRTADTLAALTAGAAFLSGDDTPLEPTTDRSTQGTEAYGLIETILSKVLRITHQGTNKDFLISEMLQKAYFDNGEWLPEPAQDHDLVAVLSRFGIRMGNYGKELWLAYSHHSLTALLKHTMYEHVNVKQNLKNLPDVKIPVGRNEQLMKCVGYIKPYAIVPIASLETIGFAPDWTDEEVDLLNQLYYEKKGGEADDVKEE